MQQGLPNHIKPQQQPSAARAQEGAAGTEVSIAKIPVGRTQSARPAAISESSVEPMPAKSVTSEVASLGLEDSTASEPGQSRPRTSSASNSFAQVSANSVATASPSRESRERAEEVARKVVRTSRLAVIVGI